MSHVISVVQNAKDQLDLLAAQRQIYSSAKTLLSLQFTLGVPVSIGLAIWVFFDPAAKWWATVVGGAVIAVTELCLEPLQKRRTKLAAKIQELFDCRVLQLNWNDMKVGSKPDIEDIATAANKYRPDPRYPVTDWYSSHCDRLPIHLSRLVCQQSNLRWDMHLRERYRTAIVIAVVILVAGQIVGAAYNDLSVRHFFLYVFGPLAPAFWWCVKESRKQASAIEALDRLKCNEERLWQKAVKSELAPDELTRQARDIQNDIFDRRAGNPLVFDWIYQLLKRRQEQEMQVRAEQRVKEAEHALLSGNT